jgi:hypothetical protein
VPIVPTDKIHV